MLHPPRLEKCGINSEAVKMPGRLLSPPSVYISKGLSVGHTKRDNVTYQNTFIDYLTFLWPWTTSHYNYPNAHVFTLHSKPSQLKISASHMLTPQSNMSYLLRHSFMLNVINWFSSFWITLNTQHTLCINLYNVPSYFKSSCKKRFKNKTKISWSQKPKITKKKIMQLEK